MGNFRKIHTIHSFSGFQGQGGGGGGEGGAWWRLRTGNLKAWGKLMSGILNAWGGGGFRSGISTETDKSIFLENAFFMDLKSKA